MFTSRTAQSFGMLLLVNSLSIVTRGEVLITYESDIDRVPSTPDIIDLNLGETATITIGLTALDGETDFAGGAFLFEGVVSGGDVENGILRLSEFRWADPLQDPGIWLTSNDLPAPQMLLFFPGPQPFPATLATVNVSATDSGMTVQNTGPIILGEGGTYPLAEGSDSFTVRGIPEPATALLLTAAITLLALRRATGQ